MRKLKILITGIGLTGKSTFRRTLKNLFLRMDISAKDIDGDYEEMPQEFEEKTLYLIEDVHGPTEEACLSLANYDLIFYLWPSFFSHLIFWLKRIWRWFQEGEGSWDKKRGNWLGSGKRYDPSNLPIFFRQLIRDFLSRKKWIAQDIRVLSQFKNIIVIQPQWTRKEIRFNPILHFHRL